jgi:hypothetical protein
VQLLREVESIVKQFRPAFGREATFAWFVVVFYSLMLRMEMAGVTSLVRCMGLHPDEYLNLLHFFHSSAFSASSLCETWLQIVQHIATPISLNGTPLYLVDGVKVGKAGRRMPGVKLLHQESDDNTKPEYIMGHYWGVLSYLITGGTMAFALPLRCQIQDGLKRSPTEVATLIDKMGSLVTGTLIHPSIIVADAYYTTRGFLSTLRNKGHHYIGKAKSNSVGYELPPSPPAKRRRGRPRKYGKKVELKPIFDKRLWFTEVTMALYGGTERVRYYCSDLLWQDLYVRFVLTIMEDGARSILLCTDSTLHPEDIILAYSYRQKIEVSFKTLIHILGGFAYHFWMKNMEKLSRNNGNQYLHRASDQYRAQVYRKIEAYERFVNISAMALGTLQLLSVRFPSLIWNRFPVWLRTLPAHGIPSEHVVRLTLQHDLHRISLDSNDSTLLHQILATKQKGTERAHPIQLAQ